LDLQFQSTSTDTKRKWLRTPMYNDLQSIEHLTIGATAIALLTRLGFRRLTQITTVASWRYAPGSGDDAR
jgi:hypothetical protein